MEKNDLYGKSIEEIVMICKKRKQDLDNSFQCFLGGTLLAGTLSVVMPILFPTLLLGDLYLLERFLKRGRQVSKSSIFFPEVYMNSLEYQNVWILYQYFLEEFKNFSKQLNWDNEMKLFAGYCYLLKQGYLSLGHEFYYSMKYEFSYGLSGSTIFSGLGDCKHINFLLNDLLHVHGFQSYNLDMRLDKKITYLNDLHMKSAKLESNISDEKIVQSSENVFKIIQNFIKKDKDINHVAVLFKDEHHSYVMDACNDTLFFSNDRKTLYQGGNNFFCEYDDWCNACQKVKLSEIMLPTNLEKMKVLINDYYQVWNSCFECTDFFEQFYLEHKDLYADIVDKKKILIRECERNRRR